MKYIIVTVGHTAAGKTTLARFISNYLNSDYISEGEIKRSLLDKYTSEDSLNENLRDQGYLIAIKKIVSILENKDVVVLDASFHKLLRRKWLYEAIKEFNNYEIVWLYCHCDDLLIIKNRIGKRNKDINKCADNQADKLSIYEHIISTFDSMDINTLPDYIATTIIEIDTNQNKIINIESNSYNETNNFINNLINTIKNDYLEEYNIFEKNSII